jgi:MFS family permease
MLDQAWSGGDVRRSPTALVALSSRTGLRRVLAAYACYDFVEFFVWLAVILWAFDVGDAYLAGFAALIQLVPAALLAPAIASVGDRIPRGTALMLAYSLVAITCAVTMVALAAGAAIPVVIAAATVTTTAIAVVRPIHFAALPQLSATPDELVSGNSLSSVADGTFRFFGPVAAGFVVAVAGYWQVFAIGTGLALLAAVLCVRLGLAAPGASDHDEVGGLRAAAEGIVTLWGDWGSLALLLVMTVDFVLAGALDVLGVSFAGDVLGIEQTGSGLLIGSLGIGGLVGAFAGASLSRGRHLAPVIVTGGVVEGLAFAGMAVVGALTPAMVLLAVSGTAGAAMLVSGRTLLQRATDDRVLARVFAIQESTTLLGTAVGSILAPVLIAATSSSGAFVPLGLACALVALSGLVLLRRLDARAVYRPEETALLRGVPFLSVVPEYDLARLAKNARWSVAAPGTVVIRQGEQGRQYYIVAEGSLSVTVDGVRRPSMLGPGDGFGEIALLHAVPRTASITAETSARLLVVEATDFLAAVTGNADGHAIAAETTANHLARDRESR